MKSRWYIGAAIVGATTIEQLEENIDATQGARDRETLSAIEAIQTHYPNPG